MIKSMTGFGKATIQTKEGFIDAEIRTVNHKYFEMGAKLPEGLSIFEDKIREIIQKKIRRGKINLTVTIDGKFEKPKVILIDRILAKNYLKEGILLKKALRVKGELDIKDIVNLPGIISYTETKTISKKLWQKMEKVLSAALVDLEKERAKEGAELKKELLKRIFIMENALKMIDKRSYLNIDNYRNRLSNTIKSLSGAGELDKTRIETEVAIFAKNCDITEEITRLKSHLKGLKYLVNTIKDEAGKKIDFISQELTREINTIGSKSSDFKISEKVIEIKGEIEKIREQAKNIE